MNLEKEALRKAFRLKIVFRANTVHFDSKIMTYEIFMFELKSFKFMNCENYYILSTVYSAVDHIHGDIIL